MSGLSAMGPPAPLSRLAPGLGLVLVVTMTAYLLARAPLLSVVGPLILALVIGMFVRRWRGVRQNEVAGATFAARTLLRVGVVLLGVRLDLSLLASVGPEVLLGSVLVVGGAIVLVQLLGRWLGLSSGLRTALALGSGICGASAILAATAAVRISDEDAGVAVGVISFVGTIGALAYAVVAAIVDPGAFGYGLLVGLTLQEVGQVIAAGYSHGTLAGDTATLVKLTRVALLAPALVVYSRLPQVARRVEVHRDLAGRSVPSQLAGFLKATRVPPFLLGFLVVAALQSLGAIPAGASRAMEVGSILLTASAMAGLGLGLDMRALRRFGPRALIVGAAAFLGLVALALLYSALLAS